MAMTTASQLKCPECKSLFLNPVFLPCKVHSICQPCALNMVHKGCCLSTSNLSTLSEEDSMSVSSEADSGVFLSNGSSSNRLSIGSHSPSLTTHTTNHTVGKVHCSGCNVDFTLDEAGVRDLQENTFVADQVEEFLGAPAKLTLCEMCQDDGLLEATTYCEQCEVYYCSKCRENFHPSRGPLKAHTLVPAYQMYLRSRQLEHCETHSKEVVAYFCIDCTQLICSLCLEISHAKHPVQAIGAANKLVRTEISQVLNSLSEKARQAKDLVTAFKASTEAIQEEAMLFETRVGLEIDAVIGALQRRKEHLIADLEREKVSKVSRLKNEVTECSHVLRQTTGLIEYCLEALQEKKTANFLEVSGPILKRVHQTDMMWRRKLTTTSGQSEANTFRYKIDCSGLRTSAEELCFSRLDRPAPPLMLTEDCYAENNSCAFAWRPHPLAWVDGYVLQLDESGRGRFREVYRGSETRCTVDGLHFNTVYKARVRAFNERGASAPSEAIALSTAKVAWFHFDAASAHPDLSFSNGQSTVTSASFDDRVALGSVGFSRGTHYWELTIDRYDSVPDPAFGVARYEVKRDQMLGKDVLSWALYIDRKRSWFMHDNTHSQGNRGGIASGSVIGVLLDFKKSHLQFFLDGQKLDTFRVRADVGVLFPAVSLNRNVQVTIHTGISPPPS